MDESVSAFAMYSTNKKDKKKRLRKRKKNAQPASPSVLKNNLEEDVVKKIGIKLKRNQKKNKETKNIVKKKLHKKKKNKKIKKSNFEANHLDETLDSDDMPELVPAPLSHNFNNIASPISELEQSYDTPSSSGTFTPVITDSIEEGIKVFKWMIAPFDPDEFLNQIWEKKPLHIRRKKKNYYKEVISTSIIDNMLRQENIQFTKNIDVTSYMDGKRETHNPGGRAHPHLVWDFYLNGCSIRLLNPQTYIPKLHLMNATMQEFLHSFVGANAYLTPPDSQGFAPHYDDIEAFILQAEGRKHWRIYKPREEGEILPRVSSKNFTDDEIGEPLMEVTLEAGDMLYFPRGYIHQGVTIDGQHSLHVTISMYQKQSWADLFEAMVPEALQAAINENVEMRKGLPLDIGDNFGFVHSDSDTPRRTEIIELIENFFDKIKNYLPIDEAVDQMSKKFQQDALPPVLSDLEKAVTVYGNTDVMLDDGKVVNRVEMSLDTKIRLLRKNILRMVSEDCFRIYYYAENSLEYHGIELPYLEIDENHVPAIQTLITSYPEYVSVENLEIPNVSDKLQIADALWSRGLIMTENPLEDVDDD